MNITEVGNTMSSAAKAGINYQKVSRNALDLVAKFWFFFAVVGQSIFAYYIVARYFNSNFTQKVEELHFTGDEPLGIIWLSIHILLAFIITVSGPIQLIPQIRNKAPLFHRINGRLYVFTALVISVAGVIALLVRGPVVGIPTGVGNITNAIVIIICALLTTRFAMQGNVSRHRRWALRLFIAVSGTWFYRVILMFWFAATEGSGHTDAFDGPFDLFLAFGSFGLPLITLQMYFTAQKTKCVWKRSLGVLILFILTLMMGVGIAVATLGMWLPMS